MTTNKQITANRENAQLSTGPTSETGREAVSQNATKHGLTGRVIFISEFEREAYNKVRDCMLQDLNAITETEYDLVDKMAESMWRSKRAVELQDECIDTLASEEDEYLAAQTQKKLELYMRYQASHDRAFQRYAAELRKLQIHRQKTENGFVSQKRAEAQEQRRQSSEIRHQERHASAMHLDKIRIEHRQLVNRKLATAIREIEIQPNDLLKAA